MKKTIRIFALFSLLSLFGACGEGFRSQSVNNSFQPEESEYFDSQGNRRSFTETDLDQEILSQYMFEMQGQESATRALSQSIRAFDLILAADQNQNFSMQARIAISCNESFIVSSSINRSQLQSLQAVPLGRSGPYDVDVRCTNGSCQELVAIIRKVTGTNQGTVLAGLAVGGQREGEILYVSRGVGYDPYFATFTNVQSFEQANSCSVGTNGGSNTIGEVLTDTAVDIGLDLLEGFLRDTFGDNDRFDNIF